MKYWIQYVIASIVMLFSTLAAWYEGSAIRDNPWEWKYTAYFSKLLNGEITSSADLSQLDHFIYAAKFSPIYPSFIVLNLFYILILSGNLFIKSEKKRMKYFIFLCIVTFLIGAVVSDSPTIGGRYFAIIFTTLGIIHLALAFSFYLKMKKRKGHLGNLV
ncbi:YjdJ family protein [Metabacillus halosaccharovorans]|uniref:YjdJ family protein n=1 Tax=Metabacillus halosaccharovorans TaxID=930124 RepID=UPI00203E9073|nr:YjdJ family protein [Metabacillus halosaccharovorans]MCM3443847.1 YjdJ family protein [Metabacillus halosaccharovorans]